MKIVNLLNNIWTSVQVFLPTWGHGVGELPDEANQAYSQANHQTPEGTLEIEERSINNKKNGLYFSCVIIQIIRELNSTIEYTSVRACFLIESVSSTRKYIYLYYFGLFECGNNTFLA